MSNNYFSIIDERKEPDSITLEELDHSHPRSIITLYNGFNYFTKIDHEISSFNAKSLYEMILHNKKFNPMTREPFDKNQITRIKWYKQCLELYPTISHEDIADYKQLIQNWLLHPLDSGDHTSKAQYFVTYDQIIDFFGFKEINTREKAEEYFILNPDKTWVIRKSSLTDTKYNQFFVIMIKKDGLVNNHLFVHRQGYGICGVKGDRNATISEVELIKDQYYTNIIDLLIWLYKYKVITLS